MVVVTFALRIELENVRHRAVFFGPFLPSFLGHETERSIGLRIEVDEKHTLAVIAGEMGGEIDRKSRFTDSPFHINERDDDCLGHGAAGFGRDRVKPEWCHVSVQTSKRTTWLRLSM